MPKQKKQKPPRESPKPKKENPFVDLLWQMNGKGHGGSCACRPCTAARAGLLENGLDKLEFLWKENK